MSVKDSRDTKQRTEKPSLLSKINKMAGKLNYKGMASDSSSMPRPDVKNTSKGK